MENNEVLNQENCLQGYTKEEAQEKFGKESTLDNCMSCTNFSYKDGIGTCKKYFN